MSSLGNFHFCISVNFSWKQIGIHEEAVPWWHSGWCGSWRIISRADSIKMRHGPHHPLWWDHLRHQLLHLPCHAYVGASKILVVVGDIERITAVLHVSVKQHGHLMDNYGVTGICFTSRETWLRAFLASSTQVQ